MGSTWARSTRDLNNATVGTGLLLALSLSAASAAASFSAAAFSSASRSACSWAAFFAAATAAYFF